MLAPALAFRRMLRRYVPAFLIFAELASQSLVAQTHPTPTLEIHIGIPVWTNGCLDLTVERVNTSSQTIYLPQWEGLLILLSTKRMHDDPSKTDEDVWLPIYGLSDNVSFDAQPVAAGSRATNRLCLPGTSAVVNPQKETRRQITVRGHLQIVAGYFSTEEDWRAYKTQREQMLGLPHEKWPTNLLRPWEVSSEILLPCSPTTECGASCNASPLITEGEQAVVPDVYRLRKDWNDRGEALGETLDRLYPACGR